MRQVSSAIDGSNIFTSNLPVAAVDFQSTLRSESPDAYPRLPNTRAGSSNRGNVCRNVPWGEWDGILMDVHGMIFGYTTKYSADITDCNDSRSPRISPV